MWETNLFKAVIRIREEYALYVFREGGRKLRNKVPAATSEVSRIVLVKFLQGGGQQYPLLA